MTSDAVSSVGQRYTLAQLARRVGISEGRARVLLGKDRLPDADGQDADGRPWWVASTIDRWCRTTGRPVPADASWPYGWPDATAPAPVVHRGEVTLSVGWSRSVTVYVIVWDTPHGHVVHVSRYAGDIDGVSKATAATAAAHVLERPFWNDAIVIVPTTMPPDIAARISPHKVDIDVYRLQLPDYAEQAYDDIDAAAGGRMGRLRAWIEKVAGEPLPAATFEPMVTPDDVKTEHLGFVRADPIAAVLGRPVPIWIGGTCTRAAAQRLDLNTPATLTVPDTASEWPAARDRFAHAVHTGMGEQFPAALAVLAQDALDTYDDVTARFARLVDQHGGAYYAARPERPAWDLDLELRARSLAEQAETPNLTAVIDEMFELRRLERETPWRDPAGDILDRAYSLLVDALRMTGHPGFAVDRDPARYLVDLTSPATAQYLASCAPMGTDEQDQLLTDPTRQIVRLLLDAELSREEAEAHGLIEDSLRAVIGLYVDPAGRLVARLRRDGGDGPDQLAIEWPRTHPDGWNEHTTIVGDDVHGAAGLFAVTPQPGGASRIDPVPNPGAEPRFAWGYTGTGPVTVYEALAKCALDTWDDPHPPENSQLFDHIASSTGAFRLNWAQAQLWARADRRRQQRG